MQVSIDAAVHQSFINIIIHIPKSKIYIFITSSVFYNAYFPHLVKKC
jgi:hypothetical protein